MFYKKLFAKFSLYKEIETKNFPGEIKEKAPRQDKEIKSNPTARCKSFSCLGFD